MTGSQALLLAAILIVFILWRRARRQTAQLRSTIEAHRTRNTFTFEPREAGDMRELAIFDAAGHVVDPHALQWDEHGLELIRSAAPARFHPQLIPGTGVTLTEDVDTVHVAIDSVGAFATLAPADAARVRPRLERGEIGSCIVLRQPRPADESLDLLVIHAGVDIEL